MQMHMCTMTLTPSLARIEHVRTHARMHTRAQKHARAHRWLSLSLARSLALARSLDRSLPLLRDLSFLRSFTRFLAHPLRLSSLLLRASGACRLPAHAAPPLPVPPAPPPHHTLAVVHLGGAWLGGRIPARVRVAVGSPARAARVRVTGQARDVRGRLGSRAPVCHGIVDRVPSRWAGGSGLGGL